MLFITLCFVKCVCVCLTAAGFALFLAVDEEVTGALWAEGQQDTLQQGGEHREGQQEGPQSSVPHQQIHPKDLHNKHNTRLTTLHNTLSIAKVATNVLYVWIHIFPQKIVNALKNSCLSLYMKKNAPF